MLTISEQEPDQDEQGGKQQPSAAKSNKAARWVLNGLIAVLLPLLGVSAYFYFSPRDDSARTAIHPENQQLSAAPAATGSDLSAPAPQAGVKKDTVAAHPAKIIQLDVLNGCGAKGAGMKMTNFLRANGFDVVEMKNYKSFHVQQTLVLDRIGDLAAARRVAAALGVSEKNVIQQINPDYYVEVSVIIGKDYTELVK